MRLKWKHIRNGRRGDKYFERVRQNRIGRYANYIVRHETSDLLHRSVLHRIRLPTKDYLYSIVRSENEAQIH